MRKFSPEFREHALEVLREKGYKKASEELHVHKETLYRWKRDAGIVLPVRKRNSKTEDTLGHNVQQEFAEDLVSDMDDPLLEDEDEEDFFSEDTRLPSLYPKKDEVREEDFELLMIANEKLRKRNAHLRKVINALLDS